MKSFTLRRLLVIKCLLFCALCLDGQDVYKTPSGERYHLASCRMVENVSEKLESAEEIRIHGLSPCKICKPPLISGIQYGFISSDKSVGESERQQCRGLTLKGRRCQHKTRLGDGYCYQHRAQLDPNYIPISTPQSHPCGAKTQSGRACTRSVREGVHCFQHGG